MTKSVFFKRLISWPGFLIAFFLFALLTTMLIVGKVSDKTIPTESTKKMVNASGTTTIWDSFPGAKELPNGSVSFSAINRKIVNQDGSGGQANSPVNSGGPRLVFSGDFSIALTLSALSGGESTFRLYKDMPIIYDEWRHEGASMSFTFSDQKLVVQQWNGLSEVPNMTKTYVVSVDQTAQMSIDKAGDNVIVKVNGKLITSLPSNGLFTSNGFWFGADATGDGWILNSLSISGKVKLVNPLDSLKQTNPGSLATLATTKRSSLKIGTAISLYPLMTDQSYRDIALNQFNIWTPENEMKAQFIHPSKDTFVFQDADLMVNTALKNDIAIHGHALVFGEANASWMQTTPKAELKSVMENHITTIMQHYAGKVSEWDVINEPLADYDTPSGTSGLRKSIWYNAMGEDFIADALFTARKADPTAKLYINEFGLESNDDRWDTFIKLIQKLQTANVPLDGIGFQSHVYNTGDEIGPIILKAHIEQLKNMGLVSHISEIDVHGENLTLQTQQYQAILSACRDEANCTSFTTWGITDKYGSTTADHTYPPEYGNDLLWDSNFQPKAALSALLSVLK